MDTILSRKQSILTQYNRTCDGDEECIYCPDCNNELNQWYDEAVEYLEEGLCPICDCKGIEECSHEIQWYDRCEHCSSQVQCERAANIEQQYYAERQRELTSYRCYGNLSHSERQFSANLYR